MRKRLVIAIFCTVLALFSCARSGETATNQSTWKLPKLLTSVASDALVVEYSSELKNLTLLEEDNPIFKINFGKLSDNKAVISFFNAGAIVPVLSLNAENADSADIASLQIQARNQKLYIKHINNPELKVFLISSSESRINAAQRHIDEKVSILDAKDFAKTASLSANHNAFIVAKSQGASAIIKKWITNDQIDDKLLNNFVKDFAQSYTFYESGNKYHIRTLQTNDSYYFHNILGQLPYCNSHLAEILPKSTKFALSLPLSLPQYRYEYETFTQAHSKQLVYQSELKQYTRATKTDPLKWELENKIQEVSLLKFGEDKAVILLRTGIKASQPTAQNPDKAIVALLYGKVFGIDDSFRAQIDNWIILGSQDNVNQFISEINANEETEDNSFEKVWPKRNVRAVVYNSSKILCWNKNGIEIWTQ